ncbi:MAG: hypothetical protein H6797_01295 [Candidatus Nomurabacteria bacterium]|nr:MAG: hypothetical protein H6797_01295 [Candidatus Nomurabacteria bacterium]
MLLVTELLRWWYTAGWRGRAKLIAVQLDGTIDYFSMDLLIKTLFAPYRQISAGGVDGSLEVKMRALVDKLFSRIIGAAIRLVILIIGAITIMLQALMGGLILLVWGLAPLFPVVGFILSVKGPVL